MCSSQTQYRFIITSHAVYVPTFLSLSGAAHCLSMTVEITLLEMIQNLICYKQYNMMINNTVRTSSQPVGVVSSACGVTRPAARNTRLHCIV